MYLSPFKNRTEDTIKPNERKKVTAQQHSLFVGIKEENAKKEAKQVPSTPASPSTTTPTTPVTIATPTTTTTTSNQGPAWKRALDVEDEVNLALEFTQKLNDVKMKVGENAVLEAHYKKGGLLLLTFPLLSIDV